MALPATLAEALAPQAIGFDVLQRRYRPLLAVLEKLLGVVPNSCTYLEIWPVAFRTCNLLIPTFLNLPSLVLSSGDEKKLVGLVMYASSRAAGCAYCTAHCCSFALRRGASETAIANAAAPAHPERGFDSRELHALGVADAIGRLPDALGATQRKEFLQLFSGSDAECLVLAMAMMGFLNKFMDGVGVPLEDAPFEDATRVIAATGWAPGKHRDEPADTGPSQAPRVSVDSLRTNIGLLPLMPSLIAREVLWTRGVPRTWPDVGHYLRERTDHDYPVLANLRSKRAIRGLATVLRDNTDPTVSQLSLRTKALAGSVYAETANDERLLQAVDLLAGRAGATAAQRSGGLGGLDAKTVTALELARAASTSPSQITPEIIDRAVGQLAPAAIVELMAWISLLQLMHRLHAFYS
jgi:alkylhydroperoxidase family enzyme